MQTKSDPTKQALLNQTSWYHVALLLEVLGLGFGLGSFDPLSSAGGIGRTRFFLLSRLLPSFSLHGLRRIVGFRDRREGEDTKFEEKIVWAVCE